MGDSNENNQEQTTQRSENIRIRGNLQGPLKASIKLTRLATRSAHHVEKLTQNIEEDFPPGGLTPNITPNVPDTPTDFIISWSTAQHDLGIKLTTILKNYWTKKGTEAQRDLKNNNDKLKDLCSPDQWNKIQEILNMVETDTKQQLRRRKPRQTNNSQNQGPQTTNPPAQVRRIAAAASRSSQPAPQ